MVSDDFFDNLPEDPILAAHEVCKAIIKFDNSVPRGTEVDHYDEYLELLGLFQAFCDAYGLAFNFPPLSRAKNDNAKEISDFFRAVAKNLDTKVSKLKLDNARLKFSSKLPKSFTYNLQMATLTNFKRLSTN